jgi:hypothetical protein
MRRAQGFFGRTRRTALVSAALTGWRIAARGLHLRAALLPFALGVAAGILAMLLVRAIDGDEPSRAAVPAPIDQRPDVSVGFSDGLLTALIRQSIEQGESPVPLERVTVETDGSRLVVRGEVVVLGRRVGGRIEMEPTVVDGSLQMDVREAKLGPLPVPANVGRLAEKPINDRLATVTGGLPATVTSARVSDGGLVVTARVHVEELEPQP